VVALLLRFYLPEAGSILLDGVDIAALPFAWLRSHIGCGNTILI
jgi:ABC-type multidrug transport system fused ATPase/permease subunit